jgi:hypothetical protein
VEKIPHGLFTQAYFLSVQFNQQGTILDGVGRDFITTIFRKTLGDSGSFNEKWNISNNSIK